MNRAPTTLDAKLHGYVHTRETRAYEQNAAEILHSFEGFGRPGIAKITGTILGIPGGQRIAWRKISLGEHYPICQHATATAQIDLRRPGAGWRERERLV